MFGADDDLDNSTMPNYLLYGIIALFVLILIAGLAYLATSSELFSTNKAVNGEIFVVTEGRDNIKLALVEVCVIPEKQMLDWIESKERKAKIEIPKAKNKLDFAEQQLTKISNETKLAEGQRDQASSKYLANIRDSNLYNFYNRAGENLSNLLDKSIEKAGEADNAKAKYNYWFSPEFYLDGLTQCKFKAKTNADGKFNLSLPSKRYAIAAITSRQILEDRESYFWLVWLEPEADSVSLTNDNLIEKNSAENVIKIRSSDY